jgi:hypothetical protein
MPASIAMAALAVPWNAPGLVRLSLLQRTNTQDPRTRAITGHAAASSAAGAVQDAGADVAAGGLVEGHHDGTVAQVTDIRRLADPTSHHFIISTFHFIIA